MDNRLAVWLAVGNVVAVLMLAGPMAFLQERFRQHAKKPFSEHWRAFLTGRAIKLVLLLTYLVLLGNAGHFGWRLLHEAGPVTNSDVLTALAIGASFSAMAFGEALRLVTVRFSKVYDILERMIEIDRRLI